MSKLKNNDQAQIENLKAAIANITAKMAQSNFSESSVKTMDKLRQRHRAALAILEKHQR